MRLCLTIYLKSCHCERGPFNFGNYGDFGNLAIFLSGSRSSDPMTTPSISPFFVLDLQRAEYYKMSAALVSCPRRTVLGPFSDVRHSTPIAYG